MGEVFMAVSGRAGRGPGVRAEDRRDFQPDRNAEDLTQRFLDEAKVVTQLSHENLVYVFDFGIAGPQGLPGHGVRAGQDPDRGLEPLRRRTRWASPPGWRLFLISEL
jgi:hypothetical protein